MKPLGFYLKIATFFIFSNACFSMEINENLNNRITDLIRPNWPYEAFLAIPRISEMTPILAIEFSKDDQTIQSTKCVELFYLELQKKFESKALLERESLHKLLCKAMKRAIHKTEQAMLIEKFPSSNDVTFRFDFFNGLVSIIEIPYPPLDPMAQLENVFLDENSVVNFGGIEFPEEFELEISQTPL